MYWEMIIIILFIWYQIYYIYFMIEILLANFWKAGKICGGPFQCIRKRFSSSRVDCWPGKSANGELSGNFAYLIKVMENSGNFAKFRKIMEFWLCKMNVVGAFSAQFKLIPLMLWEIVRTSHNTWFHIPVYVFVYLYISEIMYLNILLFISKLTLKSINVFTSCT